MIQYGHFSVFALTNRYANFYSAMRTPSSLISALAIFLVLLSAIYQYAQLCFLRPANIIIIFNFLTYLILNFTILF